MSEHWKAVPGYEDYKVSDKGRVKNLKTGNFLGSDKPGYSKIALIKDGKVKMFYAHELVMLAFKGPRPPGTVVDHIDHKRKHNTPDNLRYVSVSKNGRNKSHYGTIRFKFKHELSKNARKIDEYNKHKLDNIWYDKKKFYHYTGEHFRQLFMCQDTGGNFYVTVHDTSGVPRKIAVDKFEKSL